MTRTLYRWLIALHPAQFRRMFGDEMLCIFDDAKAAGTTALFIDALTSLFRQWLLRSGAWKMVAAVAGAVLQIAFVGIAWLGLFPRTANSIRSPETVGDPGMLLLLSAGLTVAVLMGIVTVTAWHGGYGVHRARRPFRRRRL